jgi:pimeloyl-ACP methyl ester carboxylesterase
MRKVFALLSLGLSACIQAHAGSPPLEFKDLKYTSAKDADWPGGALALPEVAKVYGLATVPEVAYVELNPGGKETVVFIHGLGSYLKFWRYQLDAFAEAGYHVIALDMVGYGKSSKPSTFPYTMEAMADVVRELKNSLGVDKPILVGHSMGGQTALSYAIRYPDELKALVLTSPAGFEKFSRREKEWFSAAFSVAFVKSTPEEGIWGSVRKGNFYRWRDELNWLIEERVRLSTAKEFDAYAYAQVKSVHGLTHTEFTRASLDKITAPTIIVFGHQDRLIPNPFLHGGPTAEIMAYGHQGIKGSQLVGLERCGHTVQADCPSEYNEAVLGFLKRRLTGTPDEPEPLDGPPPEEE